MHCLTSTMEPITTIIDTSGPAHTFKYSLNIDKAKKNMCEGATRHNLERENKKTCINLVFNDGAFSVAVLRAISDLKSGPKHFVVGKESVERVSIESRQEQSGKHVDSKLVFKVNNDKIVMHIYNTRQKITIQGKKHKWFVDNYLEPFLKLRISNCQEEIDMINNSILNKLSSKIDNNNLTLDEEAEEYLCDKCSYIPRNASDLRDHIKESHSPNIFQGYTILTSSEVSVDETEITCNKCAYTSISLSNLRDHMKELHSSTTITNLDVTENSEQISSQAENEKAVTFAVTIYNTICTKCNFISKSQEEYKKHIELHAYAQYISESFNTCRSCWSRVEESDLSIQCSTCLFTFHKKCSSKKDARGAWKSATWFCSSCSLEPSSNQISSNQTASHTERTKLPPLTGRQRKSNVNTVNPESEFLRSQIDTLKGILSQNNEEIKKLKESNELKSRRINQLESQLQFAHHSALTQTKISEDESENCVKRIDILESNWSSMSKTIEDLSQKIATLHLSNEENLVSKAKPETNSCKNCENVEKDNQNQNIHTESPHIQSTSFPCSNCSFHGIHKRDLQRHQNSKHGVPFVCDKCDSEFDTKSNLMQHLKDTHRPSRTFVRNRNYFSVSPSTNLNVKHVTKPSNKPLSQPQQLFEANQNSTEYVYECNEIGDCIQKSFKDKDAFQLHMMYYHEANVQ